MPKYSEAEELLLDTLDEVERELLNFEHQVAEGGSWRTLVHTLFRTIHNLKSAFAMAGHETLGKLSHVQESLLDSWRSGAAEPDLEAAALLLEATDVLRLALRNGTDQETGIGERIDTITIALEDRMTKGKINNFDSTGAGRSLPFPLGSQEILKLRTAISSGQSPWVLEKLVTGDLTAAQQGTLPVFDTISSLGILVARDLVPASPTESVLRILFTTSITRDDLIFEIFDPFYAVNPTEALNLKSAASTVPAIPRILIVDDNPVTIVLLQHYLSIFGRVDSAASGKEAIDRFTAAFDADPYQVVLLDIMMPEIDGHGVLRAIRDTEDRAGILVGEGCKIIMQSALADFPSISESFRDLCDAYIVKPFEKSVVHAAMAKTGFQPLKL